MYLSHQRAQQNSSSNTSLINTTSTRYTRQPLFCVQPLKTLKIIFCDGLTWPLRKPMSVSRWRGGPFERPPPGARATSRATTGTCGPPLTHPPSQCHSLTREETTIICHTLNQLGGTQMTPYLSLELETLNFVIDSFFEYFLNILNNIQNL